MNMMEVPDVLPWVRVGELLVTSGYPLQGFDDGDLVSLVEGLKAKGVVALVAKFGGRYVGGLPPVVEQRADEMGFPIITMPLDLAFTDLQETYFAEVVQRYARALVANERVREYGEYLRQLLNERSTASEAELVSVFAALPHRINGSVHVCVVRANEAMSLHAYQTTCETLSRALDGCADGTLMFPYADHIALVVPEAALGAVLSSLESALRLPSIGGVRLRCGVGNAAARLVDWRRSFGQATRALQVTHGDLDSASGTIVSFADTGVDQIVDSLETTGLSRRFVEEALGPIMRDDDLLVTLHVLLRHNCSIAETAAEMTFHYNTIRNRLTRLEARLGPFMQSGRRRAQLLVACEARLRDGESGRQSE
jgi:sugar diacid utilization regulator